MKIQDPVWISSCKKGNVRYLITRGPNVFIASSYVGIPISKNFLGNRNSVRTASLLEAQELCKSH